MNDIKSLSVALSELTLDCLSYQSALTTLIYQDHSHLSLGRNYTNTYLKTNKKMLIVFMVYHI